mgnify:CR=1 FL=1
MSNNIARKICTIDNDDETRNQRSEEMKNFLINQQYPYNLVDDGIKRANEIDREELIHSKPRNENNIYFNIGNYLQP